MKTFKLDDYGDVVIKNDKIELVEDTELLIQTLKQVLNTNLAPLNKGVKISQIQTSKEIFVDEKNVSL